MFAESQEIMCLILDSQSYTIGTGHVKLKTIGTDMIIHNEATFLVIVF
jgi:hypothetical protein